MNRDEYTPEPPDERRDRDMIVSFTVQCVISADAWTEMQDDVLDPGSYGVPPTTSSDVICDDLRFDLARCAERMFSNFRRDDLRNTPVVVGSASCRRDLPTVTYDPANELPF